MKDAGRGITAASLHHCSCVAVALIAGTRVKIGNRWSRERETDRDGEKGRHEDDSEMWLSEFMGAGKTIESHLIAGKLFAHTASRRKRSQPPEQGLGGVISVLGVRLHGNLTSSFVSYL